MSQNKGFCSVCLMNEWTPQNGSTASKLKPNNIKQTLFLTLYTFSILSIANNPFPKTTIAKTKKYLPQCFGHLLQHTCIVKQNLLLNAAKNILSFILNFLFKLKAKNIVI